MIKFIIGLPVCFLVSYFSTFIFKKIAVRFKIVDEPDERKIHTRPTPLLGGLAIFAGACTALFFMPHIISDILPVFIAATVVLVVNIFDDIKGLSARFRFCAEVIAALFVVLQGGKVSFLPHGIMGDIGEIIISVIWIVGVTNAFNYLDGMDGLASGSAMINLQFFGAILIATSQANMGFLSFMISAACFGFLLHNFPRAKIFLGDAGSTFLGFILAGIGLMGNWASDNIIKISIPILILGVPIFDMIFTTIMRIKESKIKTPAEWLKYAGRDHFHHSLVELGLSSKAAVNFIWAITFFLGLSAVMLGNDKAWEGILTLLQAGVIFTTIGVLITAGKKHRSGWQPPRPA